MSWPGDPSGIRAGKEILAKGVKLNDKSDRGHYFLGCILKMEGKMDDAITQFTKAATLNKNNVEASREIRLITMRKEKDEKGIFGKIFNK